jgi:hypothetical protein
MAVDSTGYRIYHHAKIRHARSASELNVVNQAAATIP